MQDTPVFMIVNLSAINDPDGYRTYEKGFFPLLKKHGGEFVTFDDTPDTFEGTDSLTGRVIIFKFPSSEAAKAWYADADYQTLSEHRRGATELKFLTMVKTLPPRG
ncbi:MAG: DUF1330 domain-containing protein [Pseudomonadota bacterium]